MEIWDTSSKFLSQTNKRHIFYTIAMDTISKTQWIITMSNSSPPSAAYMRQKIGSALVQIMDIAMNVHDELYLFFLFEYNC